MNNTLLPKNDRKEIFGWLMYDWANSAFYTTVVSVLLSPYLTSLAQASVGKNGTLLDLGFLGKVTPESLFPKAVSLSVLLQFFLLPVLGALADYSHLKKRLMAVFCYVGVTASSLLFFITGGSYLVGALLLVVANVSFGASIVFYNAYLIDITTEDLRDSVSSWGFALGYLGGVVMLIVNLGLIAYAEQIGLSSGTAVRISLLSASLWWGLFGAVTFYLLKAHRPVVDLPKEGSFITIGFKELWQTLKQINHLRGTARFLIGYLFYNDGIQTVITMSSVFLAQELFVAKGLETSNSFLIGIFLVAQISALAGSLIFERISRVIGAKWSILISLAIWCGIVVYAYGFLTSAAQAWIMAVFIGMVLGSSQALSRSLYSQMIPEGRESSFFGLYEISERGTSWLGPLLFGVVVDSTGSYRQAILALIVFFIAGSLILLFTNTKKAIHEAGNLTPEEAAAI
jgi:UMF1 family MFS transporter